MLNPRGERINEGNLFDHSGPIRKARKHKSALGDEKYCCPSRELNPGLWIAGRASRWQVTLPRKERVGDSLKVGGGLKVEVGLKNELFLANAVPVPDYMHVL